MVAWLSCGDTSLVTWADSHDAEGNRGGGDEQMGTFQTIPSCHMNTSVSLPDLFLHSMSYPVMGLLPSKPIVQRRAMVRSLTSRISTSGGSGGSEENSVCYSAVLKLNWMAEDESVLQSVISPVRDSGEASKERE